MSLVIQDGYGSNLRHALEFLVESDGQRPRYVICITIYNKRNPLNKCYTLQFTCYEAQRLHLVVYCVFLANTIFVLC
jgi:hypothetical protein